jgi:alpha-1,6-mannosyl-glycoprotein beta-1,2-N-acetylglucosaminyltransferase
VNQLKTNLSNPVISIFHPFSCMEHPNSFPGNETTYNLNYTGDSFGNLRDGKITCCRHHFTWMIKTVFETTRIFVPDNNHPPTTTVNAFLFLEEDYVVSPTIYETVLSGLRLYHQLSNENDTGEGYFGVTLEGDHTAATIVSQWQRTTNNNKKKQQLVEEGWKLKQFKTGPMVITRDIWNQFQQHAFEYCTYDDYNWDWAIVHLMDKGLLPFRVLYPTKPQVMHIGVVGLHGTKKKNRPWHKLHTPPFPGPFHGTKFVGTTKHVFRPKNATTQLYGGWGHPADHEHCLKILQG